MKIEIYNALVTYPRNEMAGHYLAGPRTSKEVKANGYAFTEDPDAAWPFPSEKQAKAKARVVERHMGWGEGVMDAEPAGNVSREESPTGSGGTPEK